MTELLETYDLKGTQIGEEDRDKFYSEIKQEFVLKGKISKQVKSIRLLLMNSDGRIYLQKRSKLKNENPGLYDKTIGGHVAKGQTWEVAVIKECAEELGFPAAVLTPPEFDQAVKVTDLSVVGLFKKIDYKSNFESVRAEKDGSKFIQPFITSFFTGYYNGSIKFSDGESSGVEVFSLEELKEEIKTNPSKFTEDLKYMIYNYEKFIKPV